MFCSQCGTKLNDDAKFCSQCGAPVFKRAPAVSAQDTPTVPVDKPVSTPNSVSDNNGPILSPIITPIPDNEPVSAPIPTPKADGGSATAAPHKPASPSGTIVPVGKYIRYRCPGCGSVVDTYDGIACKKCSRPQDADMGYFKLYRMGNFLGVAGGFGIYIDGTPCGHIGNKQTCWIKLPYGNHKIHIACGMNRRCNDMDFTLSPANRLVCAKVHMIPGFIQNSFILESATNEEVPD